MRKSPFIDCVGEQLTFEVNPHDASQMRLAHLMVETGAGAAIRQLGTPFAFACILSVEFANPLGCLLLKFFNTDIALDTGIKGDLRIVRDDEAQLVPRRLAQHLLLGIDTLRRMQRSQEINEVAIAPTRNSQNELQ